MRRTERLVFGPGRGGNIGNPGLVPAFSDSPRVDACVRRGLYFSVL